MVAHCEKKSQWGDITKGHLKNTYPSRLSPKTGGKKLLDLISDHQSLNHFCQIDSDRIEPFTPVVAGPENPH